MLILGLALAALAPEVPWPWGRAPTTAELQTQVADALRLSRRERLDELAAAAHPGEESDSAVLHQREVDAAGFDLEVIFLFGDSFFSHEVQRGLGGLRPPRLARVHAGPAGGIDSFSCAGCHSVGGLDGAGSFGQSAQLAGDGVHLAGTLRRNPPSLAGVGLLQALAAEMSAELAEIRDEALAEGRRRPVERALVAKGVSFGAIRVDGERVELAVEGVDPDLVVKPFGWKGDVARLRRMVEEASRLHFGVQSTVLEGRRDPARLGDGPAWDPDDDGVPRELEEGALSLAAAYLAMLEVPAVIPPAEPGLAHAWSRGSAHFDAVGCAGCHLRSLHLDDRMWEEHPDSTGGPPIVVNLLKDGDLPKGRDDVMLFSDLKRHDLGPELAEAADSSAPAAVFLTRPLWGVADTAPYLHDGRAPTLRDAILAHGGEALAAREAFAALEEGERRELELFLLSLSRAPRVRVAR